MRVLHYLRKVVTLPPHIVLQKLIAKIRLKVADMRTYRLDQIRTTYALDYVAEGRVAGRYLKAPRQDFLCRHAEKLSCLSKYYLEHRFDLLGSGWVRVFHGMECLGVEGCRYGTGDPVRADNKGEWLAGRINPANLDESQRIWSMIDKGYMPIDWQLDFKSGYRWSESIWYRDIDYGHKPGVDVKVPWEMARMQHLPQFAWAFALSTGGAQGFAPPEVYLREFRNQVLDFIAANPPRYGVNWCCTMDVGIRVANWLVAFDMLRAFGAEFDAEFEKVFSRSVYEHGRHCLENLEYSPELRSNHYLSDIAGILFSSAYLDRTEETDCWLAFAIQEIVSEMQHEFNPDGSNFEASTSYHRLSSEIVLYAVIITMGLPDDRRQALKYYDAARHEMVPPLHSYENQEYDLDTSEILPAWFFERLERAIEFTLNITKPDASVSQFGDNDSGRFLKLWPVFRMISAREAIDSYRNLEGFSELEDDAPYPDENILDHRHLMGVAGEIYNRHDFRGAGVETPETAMVSAMLDGKCAPSHGSKGSEKEFYPSDTGTGYGSSLDDWFAKLKKEIGEPVYTEFTGREELSSLANGLQILAYPDFGLYLYRSPRLYLAVRCGSIGQNGNGGHAHNDQLGIELSIDGVDIIRDPGTYLYTPLPARRNLFRSTSSHFVPQRKGQEQNAFFPGGEGLFSLQGKVEGECLYFGRDGFLGRHSGYDQPVCRMIKVCESRVSVYDFGADEHCKLVNFYSNGYGRWVNVEKF